MTSLLAERREFLKFFLVGSISVACAGDQPKPSKKLGSENIKSFFFTSRGKTGLMKADGTSLRYLEFDIPKQVSWQPVHVFSDGRRVIFLSMEERRDGPGRPFSEYYHLTPTHLWIYDLQSRALTEIAQKERLAPFYAPALILPGEERILVQVVTKGAAQFFSMDLDGTHRKEFTRSGEGFPYGLSLSPDGKRIAFHTSGPKPHSYRIFVTDLDGSNRVMVAGHPDHLYFGTSWSPDGQWILYQDCHYKEDPGHDWSDICIGKPDGSEHRVLTKGQSQWFAASYGNPQNRGSGSNAPQWTPDGSILYIRKLPGSKPAWEFQAQRVDTDHFNRDYKPELAKGGTEICLLHPRTGTVTQLTKNNPPQWDFRTTASPDGRQILFCRARTGEPPAIWVMGADGKNQRMLTRGIDELGADHPRWLS